MITKKEQSQINSAIVEIIAGTKVISLRKAFENEDFLNSKGEFNIKKGKVKVGDKPTGSYRIEAHINNNKLELLVLIKGKDGTETFLGAKKIVMFPTGKFGLTNIHKYIDKLDKKVNAFVKEVDNKFS